MSSKRVTFASSRKSKAKRRSSKRSAPSAASDTAPAGNSASIRFVMSEFKEGDLVVLNGDNGNPWYGEVVELCSPFLVVSLLERTKNQGGRIFQFKGETKAHLESVTKHVVPERPLTRRTVKNAWRKMGYAVGVHDFCRLEDENRVELDIGEVDTSSDESDSSDSGSESDSDSEWVQSGSESEESEWEEADSSDNEFVSETHETVRQWNEWSPKRKIARDFKSVVDKIEERAAAELDERAFERGKAAPDTRRPGRGRAKRQRR
mgnify:CR=1 FL=1